MRARSTRLAGSVRDCAINLNFAVSSSPSANSIARRHAAMIFQSRFANQKSSLQAGKDQMNPSQKIGFMESIN